MDKKWAKKANKFFENKIVLYVSLFLAVTTLLGFLLMKRWNSVILFLLISFIVSFLTNNMSIILLSGVFLTNLAMMKQSVREGMEDSTSTTTSTPTDTSATDTSATNVAQTISDTKQALNTKKNDITASLSSAVAASGSNPTNTSTTTSTETMIDGHSKGDMVSVHRDKKTKNGGDRLDYASTLEAAYDNLETMLDGESLGKLTEDTQKLMKTQQELFKTMESMAPMVSDAKKMMEGFNMGNLSSLTNLLQPSKK